MEQIPERNEPPISLPRPVTCRRRRAAGRGESCSLIVYDGGVPSNIRSLATAFIAKYEDRFSLGIPLYDGRTHRSIAHRESIVCVLVGHRSAVNRGSTVLMGACYVWPTKLSRGGSSHCRRLCHDWAVPLYSTSHLRGHLPVHLGWGTIALVVEQRSIGRARIWQCDIADVL